MTFRKKNSDVCSPGRLKSSDITSWKHIALDIWAEWWRRQLLIITISTTGLLLSTNLRWFSYRDKECSNWPLTFYTENNQQHHCKCCEPKHTPSMSFTDEVSTSLGLEISYTNVNIKGEIIEQGAILLLCQQGDSHWGPQLPQLGTIGGVKMLQGQPGGWVFDTCRSLKRAKQMLFFFFYNLTVLFCLFICSSFVFV